MIAATAKAVMDAWQSALVAQSIAVRDKLPSASRDEQVYIVGSVVDAQDYSEAGAPQLTLRIRTLGYTRNWVTMLSAMEAAAVQAASELASSSISLAITSAAQYIDPEPTSAGWYVVDLELEAMWWA